MFATTRPVRQDDSEEGASFYSGTGIFWFALSQDGFLNAWLDETSISVKTESGLFVAEAR